MVLEMVELIERSLLTRVVNSRSLTHRTIAIDKSVQFEASQLDENC